MKASLTRLDMFVLDAVVHDAETIDAIVAYVNDHPSAKYALERGPFNRDDAVAGLSRLIRDGSVCVNLPTADGTDPVELAVGEFPPGNFDAAMYDLTPRGIVRCLNWDE